VDRSSSQSRRKSLDVLKQILRDGISILIFVEGTQNRTKELLQPFHDGAFRLAIDTQQSLLPLVVVGAGRLMPPGTIQLRPGLIRIFVGDEIPAEGLTADDIQMLKMKTYEQMKAILETHNSPARK
jgi:1-acyl-sn-glycerol-3-phosphate acyltransferase